MAARPAPSATVAVSASSRQEGAVEATTLLLLARIGGRRFALPVAAIVRLLPMAAPSPLPDAPANIVGVLSFGGAVLPVVDPRALLGLPSASPHPDQHLVILAARTHYMLWIDRAEGIIGLPATAITALADVDALLAPQLARVEDEHLPVLSPAALDPGPILGAATTGGR